MEFAKKFILNFIYDVSVVAGFHLCYDYIKQEPILLYIFVNGNIYLCNLGYIYNGKFPVFG